MWDEVRREVQKVDSLSRVIQGLLQGCNLLGIVW